MTQQQNINHLQLIEKTSNPDTSVPEELAKDSRKKILQQVAKHEATQWVNIQLQSMAQDPNQLIVNICKNEITIPDGLITKAVFEILFERGADLNRRTIYGPPPVWIAVEKGNTRAIRSLAELGADVNFKDNIGRTPMHLASVMGHTTIICMLKDWGADVNFKDHHGLTPMHFAAANGQTDAIFSLSELGADVNIKIKRNCRFTQIHPYAESGDTPVCIAAEKVKLMPFKYYLN